MNTAIDFTLPDQDGKTHTLSSYRGKLVLLYFYPKDMTVGCTIEAEGFRDAFKELSDLGVVVLGVSRDTVESHKMFCEKHGLPSRSSLTQKATYVRHTMFSRTASSNASHI